MTLFVQHVTDNERVKIAQIVRARTAPVRLVERARIILLSSDGLSAPMIAARVGVSEKAARHWIKRFTAAGPAGLDDAPRAGRPPIYSAGARSRVIAKARSLPPTPGEGATAPTCHWTLDRLAQALTKEGVPIKRSQIRRLLRAEHITWQEPRTWLEGDDPQCAGKRGRSSGSTPIPRQTAP